MKLLQLASLLLFAIFTMSMCSSADHTTDTKASYADKDYDYIALSKELIRAARNKSSYADIQQKLAEVPVEVLEKQLDNDQARKAFWMNVYNGFIQLILMENPELYEDRGQFFGEDRITIAGEKLSFDDIEHDIIRGSKIKWLLGYVQNPFASRYVRTFRTDETDPRIHFALNCGAISCPAVAIYHARVIEQQLDIAARQYLEETSTYKPEEDKVYVTSLFSWFRGDFGGKDGVRDMLRAYDIIPQETDPELEFKDYDWTLDLGNYKEIEVAAAG